MKIILLLIFLACFKVSASVYAQTITLNERNASLGKIFRQIEKQSGYSFFYKDELLKHTNPVSINIQDGELTDVLDRCFSNQPLTYEVVDNTIIVKPRETTVKQKIKSFLNIPLNIKGRVTDTAGRALPGAVIKIKGTNVAVTANDDGEFEMKGVSEDAVLVVTYIGYVTTEVPVSDISESQLRIVLRSNIAELESVNVVSTGYQTIPKERTTGSFAQPNKRMYESRVATDVLSKLDGITNGLLFNSNTNNTQSGRLDINIRGRSTIFANDQPLIVVDNFPYSGDINNINPNDIESVTILKDAAAASIWGVRAGNGVVVLTTKKGRLNQPLKVTLNSNVTVAEKPDLLYNPSQMTPSDFVDMEQFLFSNGKYNADLRNTSTYRPVTPVVEILALQRAGTLSVIEATRQIDVLRKNDIRNDMSKYLYRNAIKQQYAVNLSGGSQQTNYYLSAGYDKNLQNLKYNNYNRTTVNSILVFRPIKNLEVTTGINYIKSKTQTDNTASSLNTGGLYSSVYPYAQLADVNGTPLNIVKSYRTSYIQSAPEKGFLDWTYAPLNDLGLSDKTTKNEDIRLSPAIKYTLLKGLSVEGKLQYENYTSNYRDFESQQTFFTRNLINRYSILNAGKVVGYNIPLGGILGQSLTTVSAYNLRGQVNYAHSWQKHSLSAIGGLEQNETKTDGNTSARLYGYNDNTAVFTNVNFATPYTINPGSSTALIPSLAGVTGVLDRVRSYFGNAVYTYSDKYTISLSGRVDGSNYFGVNTNQKSVPLWSAGGKWAIDHEKFYHLTWLPTLQLRASYGYNGNLNRNVTGVTTSRYLVNSDYTNLIQADISNIGNPNLKWEKAGIANFGIDFALKNDVLTGSIEYFFKNGTDLIGDASVAPSTGQTVFRGNYADMKGHGIDIQLNSRIVNSMFSWNSSLIFSHATDRVTKYTAPIIVSQLTSADGSNPTIYPIVGKPVYGLWSYKWAGLDPATGNPQGYLNGGISTDYFSLNNPLSANELVYNGSARPQFFGGFNNRFSYKNLSLSVNITYRFSYYFRRSSLSYYGLFSNWIGGNREFASRWQKTGDESLSNVPSMIYPADPDRDTFYNLSEATVEKGDNIRLQDVSLSYDLSQKRLKWLPVQNLQLYAYANNLGIIWRANKLNLDPDYPTGTPAQKTFSLGLKADF
ncbi:SusC/RagA family TonB-linked outer membrane protein [Flavobacterium zepuense]|nr:SusC/RagA family TonB-linked outer membrane protein [Flavobacterium zepuense]